MKKLLLALLIPMGMNAQNIIYSNDFTAGSAGWSLGQGGNLDTWAVNSVYNCSDPTPDQGGGNYLHITDDVNSEFCASAVFLGIGSGGTVYATMNIGINTIGLTTDTLYFDWLCVGQTGPVLASYGTLGYSIDGGATWTNVSTPIAQYSGQSTWTTAVITSTQLPAMLNQADFRIRFGFVNSGYGTNPAFAIDNIVLSGDVNTNLRTLREPKTTLVSPTPGQTHVSIQNPQITTQSKIKLFDVYGKTIDPNYFALTSIRNGQMELSIENLNAGTYFLQIETNPGILPVKIIKQ